MKRLQGYLDNKETQCKGVNRVSISDKTTLELCVDVIKLSKPCKLVIIR
jgi:phage FluMu protein Com